MPKVKIITDSTAYLPKAIVKELSIEIIPLHVVWGDEMFRDGVEISPEEFYERLPKSEIMPTTSQPSPKEFSEIYKKYLDKGNDILSIHISSKLSGTVSSAEQAKTSLGIKNIEIIDSYLTSLGTGLQVIAAARAAKKGASLEECKKIVEDLKVKSHIYFLVSTLEFLKRGGRIGGAAALLGTALDLKPILTFNEGAIVSHGRVRTMKKAIVKIVDILEDIVGHKKPFYLGIAQATAPESAALLEVEILKRYSSKDFIEYVEGGLSPVIGVHAGPGALALCFITTE